MKNHMTSFFGANLMNQLNKLAIVGVAIVAAAGCGEAIDISHVGPNVVDKKIFDGEWYYKYTIVDKQATDGFDVVGEGGEVDRIRWEITETELIAHQSYERVPGTNPSNPGDDNVVAAFPITKHFDIKRGYNPTNGVETNVIEENDYDRPWWQRDYMRVDWSRNVANTLSWWWGGDGPGVNHNAGNDPTYPWKVRITPDYIETTLDAFQPPDEYLCYYLDGSLGWDGCVGNVVKKKLSFMKVDPNNDYVAQDYPDFTTPAVGELHRADNDAPIFASLKDTSGRFVPRLCTSDEVGKDGKGLFDVVDENGNTRMCNPDPQTGDAFNGVDCTTIEATCANAAPLSFTAGPEDVSVPCNTDVADPDACFQFTIPMFERFGFFRTDRFVSDRENGFTLTGRERLINRFNVWKKSHADDGSVLPMSAREVKPIVYYLNVGFPPDMLDASKRLEADWNDGFRSMIASAQGKHLSEVPQMFFIKQNDCNLEHVNQFAKDNDFVDALKDNGIDAVGYGNLEASCAVLEDASLKAHGQDDSVPLFTWQQLGDLRYSFLNWVVRPELGAGGLLGLGPPSPDPITGEILSGNANVYGANIDTYANWGADIVDLLNGKITEGDIINGTQIREHVEAVRNRWRDPVTPEEVKGFTRLFDRRTRPMSDDQYFKQLPVTAINAGFDRLAQSGLEDEFLVSEEALRIFGNDAQAQAEGRISDKMRQNARPSSLLRTTLPQLAYDPQAGTRNDTANMSRNVKQIGLGGKFDQMADYLGRKSACFLAGQVEPAVASLAADLKDQNLTREQTVQKIREAVFIAVTAHELGHTFGLRHNFEGSADPVNFFPEFWGVDGNSFDDDHKHLAGKSTRKEELQYSSIMDYHQRFNSDWGGIGLYDKAAIKFGYAGMVEVFDENSENGNFVSREWIDSMFILDPYSLPWLVGGQTDPQTGGSTADDKIDAAYTATIDAYNHGDDYASLDIQNNAVGLNPHPENIFKRRDIPVKDWLRNETLRRAFVGAYDNVADLQDAGLLDDDGRAPKVAVPYLFCSDAYAWGGGLTCNRYDMGLTSTEIVKNAGEMYEFYYPFQAFRGEKVLVNSWANGYLSRLYSRTYQPMLNAFRYFYFYRRSSAGIFPAVRDWANASLIGMNFFTRVLQTPDIGKYCKNSGGQYVPEAQADQCDTSVDIGIEDGRMYTTNWSSEYDFQLLNLGNYWDKYLAVRALTDSDAFFFRDFSSLQNRGAFSIGYYRVFQPEMLKLFGGLMRGDATDFTPRIDDSQPVGKKIVYQPFVTTDVYGQPIERDPALDVGDPIQPAQSYQLRQDAAIIGYVQLSSTLDQTMDFSQRARITISGSQSDPVQTGVALVEFRDPQSGIVYKSAEVDGADASIGFQMLNDAKALAEGPWQDAKDALDAAQTSGDQAAINAAQVDFNVQNQKLNEKVQIIDFTVLLGNYFEFSGG